MSKKTLAMESETPNLDNADWDPQTATGYEVSKMIKDGLINSDKLLNFDLDKYYDGILNKRSELEDRNYVR